MGRSRPLLRPFGGPTVPTSSISWRAQTSPSAICCHGDRITPSWWSWDAGDGVRGLAVYKPRRGEAPLYDFPDGTLYRREFAAYVVSEAIGWHLVPPTVIRDGPYGVGTAQLFIDAQPKRNYFTLREDRSDDLKPMAAFDVFANNADRKGAHCLLDPEDRIWGIDHGLTFNVDYKLRTVIWDFSGQPVSPRPCG